MARVISAFKAFWSVLLNNAAPTAIEDTPAPIDTTLSMADFEAGAVYSLNLLQREGRLIDFLQEDITPYSDAQIGAAVREIHAGCRKTLTDHFDIQPVVKGSAEGETCTAPDQFDPAVFRLTGSIPKNPPYQGTLRHCGWQADKVSLPKRTGKHNPTVVAPAEINC